MELRLYLFLNRIKVKDFALRVDHSFAAISAISVGRRIPGRRLMKAIEKETNGAVTREDCVKAHEEAKKRNLEEIEKQKQEYHEKAI